MPLYEYALLALFGLLGCANSDLSFIAVGDWGGTSDEQPTTKAQVKTSAGMQAIAQDLGSNFTLLLGDNFYKHGIAGNKNASSRFRETFRDVYAHRMPELNFYVVAGNHDYGNGQQANVSAQLDYSKVDLQWHFPSLWHKVHREFTVGADTRTVDILLIDTVILCGDGADSEIFIDNQLRALWPHLPTSQSINVRQFIAEKQWAWLEEELNTSTADFLWVAGHYPIWSVGEHGPTECLIKRLHPLLTRYNAHYISGHDHMSEHFQHKGFNAFVVGAGMECCSPLVKHNHIPKGALQYFMAGPGGHLSSRPVPFVVHGGFGSFRFTSEYVSVTLHAHNGSELYTAPHILRRNRNIRLSKVDSSVHRFGRHLVQLGISIPALAFGLSLLFLMTHCRHRLQPDRSCAGVMEALLES